jgi:hypothetical protein
VFNKGVLYSNNFPQKTEFLKSGIFTKNQAASVPTDAVRHDASNKNGESSKKLAAKVAEAGKAAEAGLQATAGDNIPEQGPML